MGRRKSGSHVRVGFHKSAKNSFELRRANKFLREHPAPVRASPVQESRYRPASTGWSPATQRQEPVRSASGTMGYTTSEIETALIQYCRDRYPNCGMCGYDYDCEHNRDAAGYPKLDRNATVTASPNRHIQRLTIAGYLARKSRPSFRPSSRSFW
jgi:hypothetical protein